MIGFEFEWEALGELSPDKHRPRGAELMALARKDLIRPHEAIQDTFRFRHMLICDAAYERIPKELRSGLHEGYADWLTAAATGSTRSSATTSSRHTAHWRSSGRSGSGSIVGERAADRLIASWERASARGDLNASANLLERAIALLPANDPRRLRLLPSLGRVLREVGLMDQADSTLTEAIDLGREQGAPGIAADAGLALADLRFHRALISREELLHELETAIAVFTELDETAALARARGLGGGSDSGWRVRGGTRRLRGVGAARSPRG